jgi:uncharacterized membrane protein
MKLKLYFLTLFIFLGIDAVWLGLVAPAFYRSQIGHLMAETVNLPAAGFFYLLFVGGMVYFVVAPGVSGERCGASSCAGRCSGWSHMERTT